METNKTMSGAEIATLLSEIKKAQKASKRQARAFEARQARRAARDSVTDDEIRARVQREERERMSAILRGSSVIPKAK